MHKRGGILASDFEILNDLLKEILGPEEMKKGRLMPPRHNIILPPFSGENVDLGSLKKIDPRSRVGYAGTSSCILDDDLVHFSDRFDQD